MPPSFLIQANDTTDLSGCPESAACMIPAVCKAVVASATCFNMTKAGYDVHVLSDCITSYDKKKLPEMLEYYANKGCTVGKLCEVM